MNANEQEVRYERVVKGVNLLTLRRGWFTMPELSKELGSPDFRLSPSKGPVKEAIAAGALTLLPAGSATTYAANLPKNLGEVLERAEQYCDNEKANRDPGARPGANGLSESDWREVHWLSETQLARARTAARRIARHLDPGRDPADVLREVSRRDLVWAEGGGTRNRGAWARMERLLEAAASGCSRNTLQGYKGALSNVLFLAATRGWIPKPGLEQDDYDPIPFSWSATWVEWRNAVLGDDALQNHGVSRALRLLFRGLAHLGFSSPCLTREEWKEALPELEEFFRNAGTSSTARGSVRVLHRRLTELEVIDAPRWDGRDLQNEAVGIFRNRLVHRIAAAYGAERDWKAARPDRDAIWQTFPPSLAGLADPTYGLPAVLTYYCVPYGDAASHEVPSRGVGLGSEGRGSGRTAGLARGTLVGYVSALGHFLGLCRKHWGVDWAAEDLRAVCDPERLLDLYNRVVRGDIPISRRRFQDGLRMVAQGACPVIVYAAKEQLGRARAANAGSVVAEPELEGLIRAAERTAEIVGAPHFTLPHSENVQEGLLRREGRTESEERLRLMAREVELAWTGSSSEGPSFEFAYEALAAARARIEARVLRRLNADSWAELVEAIAGGMQLTVKQAVWITDCLMVGILLVAPLRRAALAALRHSWIRAKDGEVSLWLRHYAAKGSGSRDSVDEPDTSRKAIWEEYRLAEEGVEGEQLLDPHLVKAVLMPGGARKVLERRLGMNTPYLWVPSRWNAVEPPAGEDPESPRLQPPAVTRRVRGFCQKAARVLGLDPSTLSGIDPVHQFRHSFGTFYVAHGKLLLAQQCLGHASLDFTVKVYSDMRPGRFSPGRVGAELMAHRTTRRARSD
jgi:hypothetical protein